MVTGLEHAEKSGVLSHGEHWVDLVLQQAGRTDRRPLEMFLEIGRNLLAEIRAGRLARVNEKIDGSPAVVFGFDADGRPFVAYKSHFTRRAQALVHDVA